MDRSLGFRHTLAPTLLSDSVHLIGDDRKAQIPAGAFDGTTRLSISCRWIDCFSLRSLADVLKPKSFAGLFGAAPSVGLATLALTVAADRKTYASIEARSMAAAALAFLAYACITCRLMMRFRWRALPASVATLVVWMAVSLGLWIVILR